MKGVVIDVPGHSVSYPEDNQQSTKKNMCTGEDSDPRDHCPRYWHFEAKTSPNGGNPIFTAMRVNLVQFMTSTRQHVATSRDRYQLWW